MLFLLYINDIGDNIKSSMRLFADDCLVYQPIRSNEDHKQLQNDLHQLVEWSRMWQMEFNVGKCSIMQIGLSKRKQQRTYSMKGTNISHKSTEAYLGVTLSNDMRWSAHINNTCAKANKMLGLLRRNLWHCQQSKKEQAYKTYVRPRLEYASSVWDPHQAYNIRKLEQVQKRAARFVSGQYMTKENRDKISTTKLVKDLGWETLQSRRRKNAVTVMYKAINGQLAIPDHYIPKPALRSSLRRSNSTSYQRPQSRIDCHRNAFWPRTIPIWNSLPTEVTTADTPEALREGLAGVLL